MNCVRHLCTLRTGLTNYSGPPYLLGCILLLVAALTSTNLEAQTYSDLHEFFCTTDGCKGKAPGVVVQARDGNFYGTLPGGGAYGQGTVFRVAPSGTLTTIYSFNTTDGAAPTSGLTLGSDGNLYGSTNLGGNNSYGTIFKITAAGVLTTLHHFTVAEAGLPLIAPVEGKKGFYGMAVNGQPYLITSAGKFSLLPNVIPGNTKAPLILATDGNFYGTTSNGGLGYGTVFRMSASGSITIIYKFDGTHGAEPMGPVVQAIDGYLYGTTEFGGTTNGGVIFKMNTAGKITVLHQFDSTVLNDGFYPLGGLISGSDGNLYGATSIGQSTIAGGTTPYGTFFKSTRTGTYSILHVFDQAHGGSVEATPAQHTTGGLYGETALGGAVGSIGVFYGVDLGIAPFVSALGIPSGPAGQSVQILGQGFNGATSVNFGAGSASFTVVNDTYLTALVPASGTTGNITVTTASGTLASKQIFKVLPQVTGISPSSGPPGTSVTITGTGLVGTTKVQFGSVNAPGFSASATGTQVTVTVPATAVTGKIKVTTAGGSASSTAIFTVI